MKSSVSKKNKRQDHYARKAKKENFPARSVYKLQEIQQKYNIIKKGDYVLDLGCSPGSWLLYAAQLAGNSGRVVGVDIKPVTVKIPANVNIYIQDILSEDINDKKLFQFPGRGFNAVISDMAPDTTGNKNVDGIRSYYLCRAALKIANKTLVSGGAFICKIFHGENFKDFSDMVKSNFNKHKIFKPQSSRKASREIYIIGFGKKQEEICRGTVNGLQ